MRDNLAVRSEFTLGAVLLAAGSASRIGYRPKCLLELDGESLIQRQLHALLSVGITHIVVVLGHYAEQIAPIVKNFPVTLVYNAHPDAGKNSSLHCGLNALPKNIDAVIVALGDQPLINSQAIDDVIAAYRQRPTLTHVIVPTVNGIPGNPVIFSDTVRDAILLRDNSFGCKQWQIANPEQVYRWQTKNENYCIDIDASDDIKKFATRTGLHLLWPSSIQVSSNDR